MSSSGSVLEDVAVLVLALYIGLHALYAAEVLSVFLRLPIPVMGPMVIIVAIIAMTGFARFFYAPIVLPYMALLGWILAVSVMFSFWGYVQEMLIYGTRFHILTPIAICAVAVRLRQVRTLILGHGVGFVVLLLFCWRYGQPGSDGRFALPNTSLENPNDLALHLLFCMALVAVSGFGEGVLGRMIWGVAMVSGVYFVFKTGSRANLLTLGAMCLAAFWLFQWRQRMVMVVASCALVLAMVVALPRATLLRLTTFQSISVEDVEQYQQLGAAIGSTEARKQLQLRAIKLTAQNPVFGVGPRMFMYALDDYMRTQEKFVKGSWQVPHNTYLDMSAETGLVGLGLYVWVVFWCLRTNYRAFRAIERQGLDSQQVRLAARQTQNLFLAAVVFSFGTLFCSVPYTGQLPMLVGLTAANWLALREAGVFRNPNRPKTERPQPATTPMTAIAPALMTSRPGSR